MVYAYHTMCSLCNSGNISGRISYANVVYFLKDLQKKYIKPYYCKFIVINPYECHTIIFVNIE